MLYLQIVTTAATTATATTATTTTTTITAAAAVVLPLPLLRGCKFILYHTISLLSYQMYKNRVNMRDR